MAENLDIDPTVVRILWIVVGIASGGLILLAYFILALVIPQAPYAAVPGAPAGWATEGSRGGWSAAPGTSNGWTPPAAPAWGVDPTVNAAAAAAALPQAQGRGIGAAAIVGVVLIVVGVIALADAVLPGWVSGAILGPTVILVLGVALLVSSIRRTADDVPAAASPSQSSEFGVKRARHAVGSPIRSPGPGRRRRDHGDNHRILRRGGDNSGLIARSHRWFASAPMHVAAARWRALG